MDLSIQDLEEENKMKNIAIIGAGLQAKRRIPFIIEDTDFKIKSIIDLIEDRAANLAMSIDASTGTNWKAVIKDSDIDVIMVLTPPDTHAEISIAAMEAGKDVFCEKPLSRTIDEAERMLEVSKKTNKILKCGFNHRHHPAVTEAYKLFKEGLIGKPTFGRGRYGIAGREGLEKEWRSDPKIVSGGQLMEQGIHLVDLFSWFFGNTKRVSGMMSATKWPIEPLEDNGFLLMENENGVIASIHSSLTQWINLFEFEIYGGKGSLCVQGLGASYGVEKLIVSLNDPNGPFSYKTIEFRGGDNSWKSEWQEFTKAVISRNEPIGNGLDGLRAMEIVNAAYLSSKENITVIMDQQL